MMDALPLLAVGIVTAVGIGLSYFGYEVAQSLLVLAGTVAGFTVGIVAGGLVTPAVTGDPQALALTAGAGIVGAVLGRLVLPAVSELAFGLAAFLVTSVAVLGVLSRGQVVDAVLGALPSNVLAADPQAVAERLASTPLFSEPNVQQALLVAAGLGVLGGAIALQFYDEFVALATTAAGAAILGVAMPLWLGTLDGRSATWAVGTEFSVVWFGLVFLTGTAFELYRNREQMSVI
jgi:hypothetical protein